VRITLDSNVLVRAHNLASGPARELLRLLRDDLSHSLVLSAYILDEVARVLSYPRLQARYKLAPEDIERYTSDLEAVSTIVHPVVIEPVVLTDPDDDPVLYTALDGYAEVLCTLNTDFYRPNVLEFSERNGIRILTDVELLNELRSPPST
jgi:putative PIN family toxin of toxin-antitoxin system